MILFINACVRKDSRTKVLADHLLSKLEGEIKEVKLEDIDFPKVDEAFLTWRDGCVAEAKFDDPLFDYAKEFAEAEAVVIAAPYYDLSFPSMLKQYIEQLCVMGITFEYSDEGFPISMCKASKLYYVTTAGGFYFPVEYGYGYVQDICNSFFGIEDSVMFKALGTDIVGADIPTILDEAKNEIDAYFE